LNDDFDKALDDLQSAFDVCKRSHDVYSRYTILTFVRLAVGHLAAKQPDQAVRFARQAVNLCKSPHLRDLAVECHLLLGQAHAQREEWKGAEAEIKNALIIARALASPTLEWRVHQSLGEVYRKQRKRKAAQGEFSLAAALVERLSRQVGTPAARQTFLNRPEVQAAIMRSKA
jgi:tetratricopeptide (TPR) repeat protein